MKDMLIRKRHVIILLLLAVFSIQSMAAITTKSATFDEVQYFGVGKYLIEKGKWDVMGAILHPPLSYYLNSIPMLFVEEDEKLWEYEVKERDLNFLGAVDYYRGQEMLSARYNADDRLLVASRMTTLLTALLLGVYVYRFSSLLFGVPAGLASLFLFSFCPNMLAFSGICVPDMPLTAFSLISLYYFWRSMYEKSASRSLLAGLFLGLALLSKFTAALLLPVEIVLGILVMVRSRENLVPRMLLIFTVALFVLFAGYQFDLSPLVQGYQYRQMQQGAGQGVFLMGDYSNHGWWYFYPLTLLMKTPVPLLVLLPIAFRCLAKEERRDARLWFVLLPIAGFLLFFCLSGYSVALRYILPIFPFFFVAAGALIPCWSKLRYLLCGAALWTLLTSLHATPHYLAYFNELFGGPGNGYKYLVDSNLDWGQDLKGLKRFMDINGIAKISLSYFGADAPQRYGIEYDWLPSHYLYNPAPEKKYDINPEQLVAVSATNLQGVYLDNRDLYKRLLEYEPVAKIGYSIFVYDLSGRRDYRQ